MIKCGLYRNFNNGWEPLTTEEIEALNDNNLCKIIEQVRLDELTEFMHFVDDQIRESFKEDGFEW